jgi:hypothetical protein
MPLKQETIDLLNSVIRTEEDQAAFEAGYQLAADPENSARLGGSVDANSGGVHVQLEVQEQSGTWLADRLLPRNQTSVLVEDAPFVLGGIVAALELKQASVSTQ